MLPCPNWSENAFYSFNIVAATRWSHHHERWFALPVHAGNVDVELDLVAVRIEQVERVGYDVIAGADPSRPRSRT